MSRSLLIWIGTAGVGGAFGILLVALLVGCRGPSDRENAAGRMRFGGHARYEQTMLLTLEHPENDFLQAKLLSIEEDGRTRIFVLKSGETLEAPIGGYFVGTNAYGTKGLMLLSASVQTGEARLLRTWCEP